VRGPAPQPVIDRIVQAQLAVDVEAHDHLDRELGAGFSAERAFDLGRIAERLAVTEGDDVRVERDEAFQGPAGGLVVVAEARGDRRGSAGQQVPGGVTDDEHTVEERQ
jgi:hypothetical protein